MRINASPPRTKKKVFATGIEIQELPYPVKITMDIKNARPKQTDAIFLVIFNIVLSWFDGFRFVMAVQFRLFLLE